MALNAPVPGLRRFVNDSRDITRVELRVAPGAEIAVDDDTATQLGPRFKDPDAVAARDAERAELAPDADGQPKRGGKKKSDDADGQAVADEPAADPVEG